MTQPRRPDQSFDPPPMAIAPGGMAGVFKGRLVIISGSSTNGSVGLFVYSGTPGLGTLAESIAQNAGTDPYGNAYVIGFGSYFNQGANQWLASSVQAGLLTFYTSTTGPGGPYIQSAAAFGAAGASNQYETVVSTLIAQDTPGITAALPSVVPVVPETWHNLGSLSIAGWTVSVARYKLLADSGQVAVQIQNLAPSTHPADGTVIYSTAQGLPSGYQPAINQRMPASSQQGGGVGQTPSLQFQTDGSIQVNGITGTTTTRLDCYAILSTI